MGFNFHTLFYLPVIIISTIFACAVDPLKISFLLLPLIFVWGHRVVYGVQISYRDVWFRMLLFQLTYGLRNLFTRMIFTCHMIIFANKASPYAPHPCRTQSSSFIILASHFLTNELTGLLAFPSKRFTENNSHSLHRLHSVIGSSQQTCYLRYMVYHSNDLQCGGWIAATSEVYDPLVTIEFRGYQQQWGDDQWGNNRPGISGPTAFEMSPALQQMIEKLLL